MKFPYYKQETKYTCGAAAMRMILECLGIKKTEKQIVKLLGTNQVRGTWNKDFPILVEKYKLNYTVRRKASIKDMKSCLKQGYYIIVCYFYPPEKVDHYSVVKKIDTKNIYFWDPWFGPNHSYSLKKFKTIWKCDKRFDNEKRWLFAVKK